MARWRRAVVVTLCLAVHGCADVTGGAVELSWKLRAASGSRSDDGTLLNFIDCDSGQRGAGRIAHIRLDWDVDGVAGSRQWRCDDYHGVTGFELPPGQALLWVSPVCATARLPEPVTYTAPAPEQRAVIVGNTISLGAMEIVLEVSSCDLQLCVCR